MNYGNYNIRKVIFLFITFKKRICFMQQFFRATVIGDILYL